MARPLRIEQPGGWYHITNRGNERRLIFRDHRDRSHFLEVTAEMVNRFRVRLHCYVLMDNHYHLLLELTEKNLSRSLQWLNVSYSVWFNRRHSRAGHLFQGRFKSVVVDPSEWALSLSRYMHLNPVRLKALGQDKEAQQAQRAGLSPAPNPEVVKERIQQLRKYKWSSYSCYIGMRRAPEWLDCDTVLSFGGKGKSSRQHCYRDYVESLAREGLARSPWEDLRDQVVLGSAEFLKRIQSNIAGDQQEQRAAGRLSQCRPSFEMVVAAIERMKNEKWDQFRDRHADPGRDMALYLGRRLCGLKLAELAAVADISNYAVVATNVKRYEERLRADAREQRRMKEVEQMLNCKM